jgi:pimeloyl-ACP methyl ester carboxylesterase
VHDLRIRPFTIRIPEVAISDLRERLARTRWPDEYAGGGWDLGTDRTYLRSLTAHWSGTFDWRARETQLNRLPQFLASIGDLDVHFVHLRSESPRAFPLLITHGWPGSFAEMTRLIPMLVDPAGFGHDPADAFDVVVPSLPGFGFSSRPQRPGVTPRAIAELWATLMRGLGYRRYGVQGGDFGASISAWLARLHPESVARLHLNMMPFSLKKSPGYQAAHPLSERERQFFADGASFAEREGGYSHIQRTKPQTLAYGLNDSPAGLAAWIVEKFRTWSDCGGDVESVFTRDELLTNISIYWFTGTIGSSVRLYRESLAAPMHFDDDERVVPQLGFAAFPKELVTPPREWAERFFDVARWTEMPRGGHFAALEQPELLAEDLRAFFREIR